MWRDLDVVNINFALAEDMKRQVLIWDIIYKRVKLDMIVYQIKYGQGD